MLWRLMKQIWRGQPKNDASAGARAADVEEEPAAECVRWLQRGAQLEAAGDLTGALDAYRACAAAYPYATAAHVAAANTLATMWRLDECIDTLECAVRLAPSDAQVFSGLLLYSHYSAHPDAQRLFELHRHFGAIMSGAVAPRFRGKHRAPQSADQPVRIGYLSRNLSRHSVGYFVEPVILHHDRTRFVVYCYYTHPLTDDTTDRFAKLVHWRHCHSDSDDELAARIFDDRIDVLVDLGGHTERNRLGVFAREPAPVQVTWLGYPDTTGLPAIGYRITDRIADPGPDADERCTERLLRLDNGFFCYSPPPDAPPVVSRASTPGIVFGSFNTLARLNERAIDLWAQILHRVSGSRLLLKAANLEYEPTAHRVIACFQRRGIDATRLELRPFSADRSAHLAAYEEIDIGLDTFPYNGTTTTCEALWMGVPVVTLTGDLHMSRVGASLLAAAGLRELIASTPEQFVQIAVALAGDTRLRAELRLGMRQRLSSSPLLAHDAFTRRFEAELWGTWKRWCERRTAPGLS